MYAYNIIFYLGVSRKRDGSQGYFVAGYRDVNQVVTKNEGLPLLLYVLYVCPCSTYVSSTSYISR